MSISQEEIAPGLVVYLDTDMLRARGDCLTNAVASEHGDRAVIGVHEFLVVGVDVSSGVCTAVPLFTKSAVGNQPLLESKKSGVADQWIGVSSYFSHWQHWRIPFAALVAASAPEMSTSTSRRWYAAEDRTALDDIRNWEKRNRAPYRAV